MEQGNQLLVFPYTSGINARYNIEFLEMLIIY